MNGYNLRPYLITIRQRDGQGWVVTHLRAIAKSSTDALIGVMDRLPVNAYVKVSPLQKETR